MKPVSRRALIGGLVAAPAIMTLAAPARAQTRNAAQDKLAELERRHPGRICVSILDMGSGAVVEHRADERILMCSTFKAIAAAFVLSRVDKGEENLDRRIRYTKKQLIDYSPVTQHFTGQGGITVAQLCEAAVTLSDNTAANFLLESFDGPAGLTGFFRSLGDNVSRLDRIEPALNYHDRKDDVRDTTSAAAMRETLRKLLFSDALKRRSRDQLAAWLATNKTGETRLRAGVPKDWTVGDKTGTNGDKYGNANDIAAIWPATRAPIIVTAFCEIPGVGAAKRDAVIAEIGRIAAAI